MAQNFQESIWRPSLGSLIGWRINQQELRRVIYACIPPKIYPSFDKCLSNLSIYMYNLFTCMSKNLRSGQDCYTWNSARFCKEMPPTCSSRRGKFTTRVNFTYVPAILSTLALYMNYDLQTKDFFFFFKETAIWMVCAKIQIWEAHACK